MSDATVYRSAFNTRRNVEVNNATEMSDLDGALRRSHQAARLALFAQWDTDGLFPLPRDRRRRLREVRRFMDTRQHVHGQFQRGLFTVLEDRIAVLEDRVTELEP